MFCDKIRWRNWWYTHTHTQIYRLYIFWLCVYEVFFSFRIEFLRFHCSWINSLYSIYHLTEYMILAWTTYKQSSSILNEIWTSQCALIDVGYGYKSLLLLMMSVISKFWKIIISNLITPSHSTVSWHSWRNQKPSIQFTKGCTGDRKELHSENDLAVTYRLVFTYIPLFSLDSKIYCCIVHACACNS